jgi:tight adherence protein B
VRGLLLAAALLPILAVAGVLIVIRLQRREQALQRRVASFSVRGQPRRSVAAPLLVRPRVEQKKTAAEHLASLIRFDPARRDQYAVPWYVVLVGALILGRVVVLLASGIVGPAAWVALPITAIFGSRFYYARADGKRRDSLLIQFPDALSLIVRAVRVGIPVSESLRAVAREAQEPTRGEFDRLQHQIAIGTPLETALRGMARRNDLPEYGFFAAALALQAQTGGGLTETLEILADIIRRRIAMKERGHALSSEARTSSLVLGALPLVTGVMLYFVSPNYIGLLFADTAGNMILGTAILSLATGMGIMRLIIKQSLS